MPRQIQPPPTNFDITGVYILGPLYPKEQKGYFDKPPDTRLTFDQFRTPFHVFDDPDSPSIRRLHMGTVNRLRFQGSDAVARNPGLRRGGTSGF